MRALRAVVGVGAACLVLGACGGDPGPVVTETPSGTATGTSSPSPSPSVTPSALSSAELLELLPPGAEVGDVSGAVVTAEFFLEQYAPMFHSGDTRLWDALSGDECGYCSESSENAKAVLDAGWTAEGGEIEPGSHLKDSHIADDGRAYVFIPAHLNAAVLVKDAGTPEVAEEASDQTFILQLEQIDGVWTVQGVQFEDA